MSSGIRITRIASLALAAVGILAVVAAVVIGFTGWPPSEASASESDVPGLLGVEAGNTVSLGDEVSVANRFGARDASATPLGAGAALLTARTKQVTPVTKTASATRKVVKRAPVRRVKQAPTARRVRTVGGSQRWRSARVSWYGPGFYGHTMAGGGKLRRNSMVVAHRSLKFGTRIQFTYHGKSVIAVVRDRGPFVGGRTFDLGPGTARVLGFSGVGTVRYRIL